jgi:alpha-L-fucosidase
MKRIDDSLFLICVTTLFFACSQSSGVTVRLTEGQRAMIDRKYGMFLHFGMNTYLGKQWNDGTDDPAGRYAPPVDIGEILVKKLLDG